MTFLPEHLRVRTDSAVTETRHRWRFGAWDAVATFVVAWGIMVALFLHKPAYVVVLVLCHLAWFTASVLANPARRAARRGEST